MPKFNVFEAILFVVGMGAAVLGFQLINQLYISEGTLSWLMVLSIFSWLILLVLFISLSLTVDIAKKNLTELKKLVELMQKKKKL